MKPFFIGNIEIKTPIIQGGMGVGISLSGLASAVANEGGIGVISCAGLGLLYPKGKGDYTEKCICGLKEEIRKARKKTKGIIGVNIMVALSNYAEMVRTAISEKNRRSLCRCRTSARPPPIPDTGKQNEVGAHCIFFKSGQDYM